MKRATLRQAGLTLVELMVGLAVGLVIGVAALGFLAVHLRESRAQVLEGRLQRDLHAAADLVGRHLRRAGYWADAGAGIARASAAAASNPYAALSSTGSAGIAFLYSRDSVENQRIDDNEAFGFRLRNGVIEMMLGAGNWQALTDATTLTVTGFELSPAVQESALDAHCDTPCPLSDAACPRQQVRRIGIAITGRSPTDAAVVRQVQTETRLRNDVVVGACPV